MLLKTFCFVHKTEQKKNPMIQKFTFLT